MKLIPKRRLNVESLEQRQLLAADVSGETELAVPPLQRLDLPAVDGQGLSVSADDLDVLPPIASDLIAPDVWGGFANSVDLVHEVDGIVFAIDASPYAGTSVLSVLARGESGELETIGQVDIDFRIVDAFVAGGQFRVIGQNDFHPPPWIPLVDRAGLDETLEQEIANVDRDPQWTSLTVSVAEGEVSSSQQNFDGVINSVVHDDDRMVVMTGPGHEFLIAIYPPPPIELTITAFRFEEDGIAPRDSTATISHSRRFYAPASPKLELHDDTLHVLTHETEEAGFSEEDADGTSVRHGRGWQGRLSNETVELHTFDISDAGLSLADVLTVSEARDVSIEEASWLVGFQVSEDGNSAVVLRNVTRVSVNGGDESDNGEPDHQRSLRFEPATFVDLIDLSGDSPQVFETIEIEDATPWAVAQSGQTLVLRKGYGEDSSVLLIDTNLAIDINAEARVREVATPDDVWLRYDSVEARDGLIVFPAHQRSDAAVVNERQDSLVTLSIDEGAFIARTPLELHADPDDSGEFESWFVPLASDLVSIDSDSGRVGFYVRSPIGRGDIALPAFGWGHQERTFVYGSVNEEGQFAREGSLSANQWLETDIDADRLVARLRDRLVEYRWDDIENPITSPLGELDPAIQAVDDQFTYTDQDDRNQWWDGAMFDVLANDINLPDHHWNSGVEIIELNGAPEGFEIVGGRWIMVPEDVIRQLDVVEFQYTISDGFTTSTANVRIDVLALSDEEVESLADAAVVRAAEDFAVDADSIEIISVVRSFQDVGITSTSDDAAELPESFVPGVIVEMLVDEKVATYSSNVDGEVIQVSIDETAFLMEVRLRAVNEAGEVIERIEQDQMFFLEVIVEDLREDAAGVFSTAFDLDLPSENLMFTGEINAGEGYLLLGEENAAAGTDFIDELSAVLEQFERPEAGPSVAMRLGMIAMEPGSVTLQTSYADDVGSENLVFDLDFAIPNQRVQMTALELAVVSRDVEPTDPMPMDVNGNGEVTAADALQVINFLGRFGSRTLDDPDAVSSGAASPEGEAPDPAMMRRMDTNSSGSITALDALVIINRLNVTVVSSVESESIVSAGDDDDERLGLGEPGLF